MDVGGHKYKNDRMSHNKLSHKSMIFLKINPMWYLVQWEDHWIYKQTLFLEVDKKNKLQLQVYNLCGCFKLCEWCEFDQK